MGTCREVIVGGARRDRTADLLHAMQALSQLSYSPKNRGTLRRRHGGVKKPTACCTSQGKSATCIAQGPYSDCAWRLFAAVCFPLSLTEGLAFPPRPLPGGRRVKNPVTSQAPVTVPQLPSAREKLRSGDSFLAGSLPAARNDYSGWGFVQSVHSGNAADRRCHFRQIRPL